MAPPDDNWFAQCVARAPGAPNHVMLDDRVAEHIPGCNLAVRRTALLEIGGFDPVFVRAGDDVDVCWRLQEPWRRDCVLGRRLWFGTIIGRRSPRTGVSRSVTAKAKRGSAAVIATVFRVQACRGAAGSTVRFRSSSRSPPGGCTQACGVRRRFRRCTRRMRTRCRRCRIHPSGRSRRWFCSSRVWRRSRQAPTFGAAPRARRRRGWGRHHASQVRCVRAALGHRGATSSSPLRRGNEPAHLSRDDRVAAHRAAIRPLVWTPRGLLRPAAAIVDTAASAHGFRCRPHRLERHDVLLLLGKSLHRRFWSETWTSGDTLLTQVVEHLRAFRFGRGIHVDDGWRADRDISVALGPWAWAHVQALVEDHGAGRCLVRTRLQLRPRPCAFALAVLTGVATVVGELYGGGVIAVALALTALVLMAPIGRQVSRGARQVIDVFAGVARDHGMQEMAAEALDAGTAAASSWRRLSATHGS